MTADLRAEVDALHYGPDDPSDPWRRGWNSALNAVLHAMDRPLASTPEPAPVAEGLDAAYRERNAVVAALIRTNGWKASLTPAPDADGWWIVYAEMPQGQVSWHISPVDIRLFDGIPVEYAKWDGHTTDEKYERVARLAAGVRLTEGGNR